jgi:Domain of unknown function (DUF1707)
MNELEARLEAARAMNLVAGTRVGWEDKEKYQHWLAELSAKGYLSSEEYDARMDWLEGAKTEDEMKVVLHDLPRMPLTEEYLTTINPQRKKQQKQPTIYFLLHDPKATGIYALVWLLYMMSGIIIGAVPVMIIGALFLSFYSLLTVIRMKERESK